MTSGYRLQSAYRCGTDIGFFVLETGLGLFSLPCSGGLAAAVLESLGLPADHSRHRIGYCRAFYWTDYPGEDEEEVDRWTAVGHVVARPAHEDGSRTDLPAFGLYEDNLSHLSARLLAWPPTTAGR